MAFADILTLILPVFGIVGVAYLARLTGLLSESVENGISDFVFRIAIPCLLFRTMITAEFGDVSPWAYWAAYFMPIVVTWSAAMFIVMIPLGRDKPTGIVAGFSACQSNTVLIGIPLILSVYGDAGTAPIATLIAIHLPIMMLVAAVLMEISRGSGANWGETLKKVAKGVALNPIIIGILAGLVWRLMNLPAEGLFRPILDSFANIAGTCALFVLGLALRKYGVAGDLRASLSLTTLKIIIHPLLVYVLAVHVFDLPPAWTGAVILFAASPSGVNAYLVAKYYGTGLRISSSTIAISTFLSVISVSFWLTLIPLPD
ncbi:MAG: AEC family transporter [Pseudomonadota bacterium]